MTLEECGVLKIGDNIKIKSAGGMETPVAIVRFDYKAVMYKYIDSPEMEPRKAMYYDIISKMTEEETKSYWDEIKAAKKFKMPKCPDCKKPIDKCKCTE